VSDTDLKFSVTLEDAVSAPAGRATDAVQRAGQAMARMHDAALKMNAQIGESEQRKVAAQDKAAQAMGRMHDAALKMNAQIGESEQRKVAAQDKAAQAMGRMHDAALKMNAAFDAQAASTGHAAEGHKSLAAGLIRIVEPAEVVKGAFEGVASGLREMGSALAAGELRGVVSGAAESLAGMASALDLVAPGLGQVAAAAIRAGGAFAAMTVSVAQGAVEMALEVNAVNEKLEATFQALGHGPEAGKATMAMLDDMAAKLPQSRTQLAEWTRQFEAMGVTDLGELRAQVRAVASAQAIGGSEGATAYEGLTRKVRGAIDSHEGLLKVDRRLINTLHELGAGDMLVGGRKLVQGMTIDAQAFGNALEGSLNEKGKGPLEAMGSELGTLKTKASEIFGHLFDGIDTSPLTDAISNVIHLGDLGTPTGKNLSTGIKAGVNAMIAGLTELVVEGEVAFLTLELYALKWGPPLKKVAGWIWDIADAVLEATGYLTGISPVIDAIGTAASSVTGGGKRSSNGGGSDWDVPTSPAHATGGLVGRPAPGEFWASVAPGEMILPAPQARQMSREGLSPSARAGMMSAAQDAPGKPPSGAQVGSITVNVHAAGGVTDAHTLSVVGISTALERIRLAGGR
jgi:hypothetical protein